MAGGEIYSQTSLPFWEDMAVCIAIGSLATAEDWLVSFTLHEPITCSYNCMIEKGFSEGEKKGFPILTVRVKYRKGTKMLLTLYQSLQLQEWLQICFHIQNNNLDLRVNSKVTIKVLAHWVKTQKIKPDSIFFFYDGKFQTRISDSAKPFGPIMLQLGL